MKKTTIYFKGADDTSFTVRGDKKYVDEHVRILKVFSEASSMEINLNKPCAQWIDKHTHKPIWLANYG